MKLILINSLSATKVCSILAILTLVGCGGGSSGGKKSSSSVSSSSSIVSSSVVSSSSSEVDSSVSSEASSSLPASSSSEVSSSSSSTSSSPWTLVWSDEFDGNEIDSEKWEHEVNCWGGGNEEKQCYTSQAKNSYVQDGSLKIVAIREAAPFCGPSKNQDDPGYDPNDTSKCLPYTSARLRTKNKADWTYGRMEIRAKMPFGKALWPAIWMLPTDYEYGGWPHSGEIDIFEAFSPGTTDFGALNEVAGTLHYGFSWPWNQYTGKDSPGASFIPEENIWDEFHTYAVEWEEEEIRWYVDGHHYGTQTSDGWFSYYWGGQQLGYQNSVGAQPFDKDFHMLLNVAVGSSFLGEPAVDAVFPQTMEVEFVRVYQCSVDPETGKGCGTVDPDISPVAGHTPPPTTRDEVYLYQGGAKSLIFELNGNDVTNTLVPGLYDNNTGAVISNPAFNAGTDGVVWDIDFNGAGNVFLSTANMSNVNGVDSGFDFGDGTYGRAKNIGEFKFDMKVLEADPNTKFRIKLDSGWPKVSYHVIETPTTGEWTEVAVRFYTLRDNDGQGSVDYSKVMNPFVIEPFDGNAHIQLNNIRIACLEDAGGGCGIKPVLKASGLTETFNVFTNTIDALWDTGLAKWDNNTNSIQASIVDSGDVDHGQVINIAYGATSGIAYIQSSTPKNASAFAASGYIEFDVKVTNYGAADELLLRVDCGHPCVSNNIPLGKVGNGVWQKVTVNVSTFNVGNFDLTKVNTPFVIFPTWDKQNGVTLQVDNIRWVLP